MRCGGGLRRRLLLLWWRLALQLLVVVVVNVSAWQRSVDGGGHGVRGRSVGVALQVCDTRGPLALLLPCCLGEVAGARGNLLHGRAAHLLCGVEEPRGQHLLKPSIGRAADAVASVLELALAFSPEAELDARAWRVEVDGGAERAEDVLEGHAEVLAVASEEDWARWDEGFRGHVRVGQGSPSTPAVGQQLR